MRIFRPQFPSIVALLLIAALTAGAQTTPSGSMSSDPMMQQMDQMMRDPQAMQRMMDRMMSDAKGRQIVLDAMAKHPAMMTDMMTQMMSSPDHCRMMAAQMSKDPKACANMMKAMAAEMDSHSGAEMMKACERMMKSSGKSTHSATGIAAKPAEYTVNVGSAFSPATIRVKKGVPVRLNFRRSGPTCATSVTFPSLGITRESTDNKTTSIDITPAKSGDLAFSCGMGMLQGKLVVE